MKYKLKKQKLKSKKCQKLKTNSKIFFEINMKNDKKK